MTNRNEEFETPFFRFLSGDLPIHELEQWIYATQELEHILGATAYYQLVSFNYHQPGANYELAKYIYGYIDPSKYYTWQLKQLLIALLNNSQDTVELLHQLYDKYRHGFLFLDDVGFAYVFTMDDIPSIKDHEKWEEKEFHQRREALSALLSKLKPDIEMLHAGLESGDIKILNEREYIIEPNSAKKLADFRRPDKAKPTQKKWWQIWR